MNPLQPMTGFSSLPMGTMGGFASAGAMQGFSPTGAMQGFSPAGAMGGVGAGLNININLGSPLDKTSFSQLGQDPFNGGFSNPFGNGSMNGLSALGMGNVPGFGGALNPTGSMFGGLMQQMQSQQQMMQMMMMMLMMMMQQKQNGFGGQQGAMPGGGIPGMGGGASGTGGGIPGFGGTGPSAGGGAAPVNVGSVGQGGQAAVDLAKKFLGRDSISCKGQLPHFQAAGGVTNNCADFVWSCLEATGRVSGQHQINVKSMEQALKQQGWRQVSQDQARPGDVWMNNSRGHVEMVSEAGGKKLIGSNGSARQTITENTPYTPGVFYTKD